MTFKATVEIQDFSVYFKSCYLKYNLGGRFFCFFCDNEHNFSPGIDMYTT